MTSTLTCYSSLMNTCRSPSLSFHNPSWNCTNLAPLIHNDAIYIKICKGMHGLPQASHIANDQLIAKLAPHGYALVPITSSLWKHANSNMAFSLDINFLGVKYTTCRHHQTHPRGPWTPPILCTVGGLNNVSSNWNAGCATGQSNTTH
jgi:hypothetical protein